MRFTSSLLLSLLVSVLPAFSFDGTTKNLVSTKPIVYKDTRGNKVTFPMGKASFADKLVSATVGKPAPKAMFFKPQKVLGPPDRVSMSQEHKVQSSCSMGRGGELVVQFSDNALVDVPGPDLYIFEVGPKVEATNLWISEDGQNWVDIGKISGSTAAVDISKFVQPGSVFRYVKLKDLGNSSGQYAGADIDAIGAIGSATRITLDSSVLFDLDKATLKPKAQKILNQLAENLKAQKFSKIEIHGHTDNQGSDPYNLQLSRKRAESVKSYLISGCTMDDGKLTTKGFGESSPIADNSSPGGQQLNRRVEVIVIR